MKMCELLLSLQFASFSSPGIPVPRLFSLRHAMKSLCYHLLATSLLGVMLGSPAYAAPALTVKKTLCEYASQPNNIDRSNPRFSWILESDIRGQKQSAYRVLVAQSRKDLEDDGNLLWDSGRIESA